MYNLEQIHSGTYCRIIWLLGSIGSFLQEKMQMNIDDEIQVLYNDGNCMIIRHKEKKYALDSFSAHSIKVSY